MQSDFTFERIYALAEEFFSLLQGFDSFFFTVHTFYLPIDIFSPDIGSRPVTGSLVWFLIGGGLTALLTLRLFKYLFDFFG